MGSKSSGFDTQMHEEKLRFEREMDNLRIQERQIEVEKQRQALGPNRGSQQAGACWPRHSGHPGAAGFMVLCFVVHILLSVWVYQDIRQRNRGSGLWIPITLFTGLLGAVVYAITRLSDGWDGRPYNRPTAQ